MNPDNFKQAWQTQSSQTRLTIDADLLLNEVRRNQQNFTNCIFKRDVLEVGTAVLMVPLWFYMGFKLALPWTWFLTAPVIVWIAGFLLVDRMRHKRQPLESGDPLRQHVESSLAQVEHQIWLLRNILWWYLLPPAISILAFVAQIAWEIRSAGWLTALVVATLVAIVVTALAAVYWFNQKAIRLQLEPRRQELAALLASLSDETPAAKPPV